MIIEMGGRHNYSAYQSGSAGSRQWKTPHLEYHTMLQAWHSSLLIDHRVHRLIVA